MRLLTVSNSAHNYLASVISHRLTLAVKIAVLERISDLDSEALHSLGTEDVFTRLDSDVQRIQGFLLTILNVAMNNFLSFVSAIIYIGWIQWKLLVVGFAIVPVMALATRGFRHVLFNSDSAAREAVSNANNQAVSGIENLSYLKKVAYDKKVLSSIIKSLEKVKSLSVVRDTWTGIHSSAMALNNAFSYVATVAYGSWLVFRDELTIGHLFAFLTLRSRFLAPL